MSLIFIHEWRIIDHDGRRDQKAKSIGTINGEHIYACQNLSTWFRIGKYIVKHDIANYLLGLTKYMRTEIEREDVKYRKISVDGYMYCIDTIVSLVNEHLGEDFDYVKELQRLQDELKGYEFCYYICKSYRIEFDYKQFLANKDRYARKIKMRYVKEHIKFLCGYYWHQLLKRLKSRL